MPELKSMPVPLPSDTKENAKSLKPPVKKKEVPVPLDIPKKMTRHTTRPCGCGRHRSGCHWQIYYPENTIITIHEAIPCTEEEYRSFLQGTLTPPFLLKFPLSALPPPVLTEAQEATIYGENTRTEIEPSFTFIKRFCTPTRKSNVKTFLEDEPFALVSEGRVECMECKTEVEYDMKAWVAHRDTCEAIDERILSATVDRWAIKTGVALRRMGMCPM